jgi:hypothetical protein
VEQQIRRLADQSVTVIGHGGDHRLDRLLAELLRDLGDALGLKPGDVAGLGIGDAEARGDGGFELGEGIG